MSGSLAELLKQYGYLAVLLGTFLEGETILLMAGFAAHQGYLSLPGVMLAAFVGSLAGDQLAFFAGRRYGRAALSRFPRVLAQLERATGLLERYGSALLVGFRFVYGIRNATPLSAGLSRIPVSRFVLLNAVGALLWATTVSAAGYVFGRAIELVLADARRVEEVVLATILGLGLVVAVISHRRRNPRSRGS